MKITLNIKDSKASFFLEHLKKFKDFVTIENDSEEKIVAYTAKGIPLNADEYTKKVMRGYEDGENGRTCTTQELLEKAKNW